MAGRFAEITGNTRQSLSQSIEQPDKFERLTETIERGFRFHEWIIWAADGDLEKAEKIYVNQYWDDVLRAINFGLRKDLIDRFAPLMPYMSKQNANKITKEIDRLNPNNINKGISQSALRWAEKKRRELKNG